MTDVKLHRPLMTSHFLLQAALRVLTYSLFDGSESAPWCMLQEVQSDLSSSGLTFCQIEGQAAFQ